MIVSQAVEEWSFVHTTFKNTMFFVFFYYNIQRYALNHKL